MKTEIEAKFLDVDHDAVRKNLTSLGASCVVPMRLMRRAIMDYPDRRLQKGELNAYIRVRDEGDKVTLTFKRFRSLSIDGAEEIETVIGSFEDTITIFESVGLEVQSIQESKRETWMLEDAEIVLDEWPWLKPFIEIEGETESDIRSVADKLGFDWSTAAFGDVMAAYRAEYPHLQPNETVGNLREVRFGMPLPEFLKAASG